MKRFLIVVLALSATSAFANAEVTGSVDFYASSGPSFSINEQGGNLVGLGGAVVNLNQQTSGYQGFAFGRPFNVTCSANACTDNGGTQVDITVTPVSGGYSLAGTLNFVQVHATVTSSKISLDAEGFGTDVSLDMDYVGAGHFNGQGQGAAFNQFTADLQSSGSLAGLTDPATFIVVLLNPFVGH